MPQWLAVVLVGLATLLGNLIATAYYYGRLTQNVASHEKRLDAHDAKFDDHGRRIGSLEARKH